MKKIIMIIGTALILSSCGVVGAAGSIAGGTIKAAGTVTGAVIKTTGNIIGGMAEMMEKLMPKELSINFLKQKLKMMGILQL